MLQLLLCLHGLFCAQLRHGERCTFASSGTHGLSPNFAWAALHGLRSRPRVLLSRVLPRLRPPRGNGGGEHGRVTAVPPASLPPPIRRERCEALNGQMQLPPRRAYPTMVEPRILALTAITEVLVPGPVEELHDRQAHGVAHVG